jgi:hypothetical protein
MPARAPWRVARRVRFLPRGRYEPFHGFVRKWRSSSNPRDSQPTTDRGGEPWQGGPKDRTPAARRANLTTGMVDLAQDLRLAGGYDGL